MTIIPAILTNNFSELEKQLKKVENLFPYVQLDIMDGIFVPNQSFTEVTKLAEVKTDLNFELHLMVKDPVEEMRRWRTIENVFRVLFHFETKEQLRSISFARKEGWEVGMVVNPDTSLAEIQPFLDKIDVLQFMTVYPGKQGAPFEEKVLPKIKEFCNLENRPLCAVDGAINQETIGKFKDVGVDIFNVGSALMGAEDMGKAKEELELIISKS